MVDFLKMFRRRPAQPKRRGFAREQMDMGTLGGRIGNLLKVPSPDGKPARAQRVDAPPLAPPFTPTPLAAAPRKAPVSPARQQSSGATRPGFLAAHAVE